MIDFNFTKIVNSIHENGFFILKKYFNKNLTQTVSNYILSCSDQSRYTNHGRYFNDINLIANNEHILKISEQFFGEKAKPIQTLNFKFGSQQPIHQDTVHFSTFPRDLMLAAWVALEDIDIDQGPITYIKNSHLLPTFSTYEFPHGPFDLDQRYKQYESELTNVALKLNLKQETFTAEVGDVFLWHPRLWHGGLSRTSSKTRLSQVTHYMASESPIYFKHFCNYKFIPRFQNPKDVITNNSLYKYGLVSFIHRFIKILSKQVIAYFFNKTVLN
jgi:ectoine hydroxylase-related dioxygenase (phytanoyl-CoA dioxygenase family)